MDFMCLNYEAQELLNTYLGEKPAEKAIQHAKSGIHVFNPYHNLTHELQVVFWTHACIVNEPHFEPSRADMRDALLAALFHDHNHSGGRSSDEVNVQMAMQFVANHYSLDRDPQRCAAAKIIEATRFDGLDTGFYRDPTNLSERAIRDADLMSIYTHEGRQLLLGLVQEVSGKSWSLINDHGGLAHSLEANAKFLRGAKMYTSYGKTMKDRYLESAIREFNQLVRDEISHNGGFDMLQLSSGSDN